ncbi:hypothetical protein ABZ714_29310 [Streptomyces sp. NPDC006798]|uniref:hypothetical protein n=1 Tax=Streptomyces sp. NPDC006798 TaxID=3155462 RepID=UPI0033E514B7
MNGLDTRRAEAAGGGGGPGRGPRLVVFAVLGALALLGVVAAAVWLLADADGDGGGDRGPGPAADARWAEGVTPQWLSGRMDIGIPVGAESPRAAYETTSRVDTGFLTFTLPKAAAETYLKENPPEGTWLEPTAAQPDTPAHGFARLGLPEPETLKDGTRYGYVCPGNASPNPYDISDRRCVRLHAHAYAPDRTRIYLHAYFPSGTGPGSLPGPPSLQGPT